MDGSVHGLGHRRLVKMREKVCDAVVLRPHASTAVNSTRQLPRMPKTESAGAPAGATAQCKDGTWSFSQNRSGTCSGHGGVSQWL